MNRSDPKFAKPQSAISHSITLPLPDIRFAQELTALGGHVLSTQNPTLAVIEFLKSRGVDKIHLEPNTLDEILLHDSRN